MPPLDLNRNHLFKLEHPTQLDFRKYAAERPTLATEGFQDKLFVTKRGSNPPTSRPPLIVVSRPCARTYEARESALLNALLYVNAILSYYIGDLHYAKFIVRL